MNPVLTWRWVTGRIRDIGQNVLQCSFRTRGRSTYICYQIYFLIAFLKEAFIRNIIIILGTTAAQYLRCCDINRKVAGSIPAGVIGIFH